MRSVSQVLVVEVAVRWRRDDRPAPDDRRDRADDSADNWLSEFRGQSIRPESLTAADRDAAGRQAAQVGSRQRPGDRPAPQPGREDHRTRPPEGPPREPDRGTWQSTPRPDPPRTDLERDIGPWAGVQRAPQPDRDGWDRRPRDLAGRPGLPEPGRSRDRPQSGGPDTAGASRPDRGVDRSAAEHARGDWRRPGPDNYPDADGNRPSWSPAPPARPARPAEGPPRRDLPAAWSAAGRPGQARPPQPGSQPHGELSPGQPRYPVPGRDESRRDGARRPPPGPRPDEMPATAAGPWPRQDHDPGARPDMGSWSETRGRPPRPAPGREMRGARPRPAEPALRPMPAPQPESAPSEPARADESWSAPPSQSGRPGLAGSLSLADLDRVRQALVLLADEPAAGPGATAVTDGGPVPPSVAASAPGLLTTEGGGDEADTTPLPVILPGATPAPGPVPSETPRGPFEPARGTSPADAATAAPVNTEGPDDAAVTAMAEQADLLPPAAAEKLDQIKDLLVTAEALSEDNLDRHFERVSERQRELIREFFEQARPDEQPEA